MHGIKDEYTHTNLSWRKSLSILGECCSRKITASKSGAIHHSPRDRVFRLLKVGHLFSSLLRTTFILKTKKHSANKGNNSSQLHTIQSYKLHTCGLSNRKNKTNIPILKKKRKESSLADRPNIGEVFVLSLPRRRPRRHLLLPAPGLFGGRAAPAPPSSLPPSLPAPVPPPRRPARPSCFLPSPPQPSFLHLPPSARAAE